MVVIASVICATLAVILYGNETNGSTSSLLSMYYKYVHISRDGEVGGKVPQHNDKSDFIFYSPDMDDQSGDLLPFASTCLPDDGGQSPTLSWSGAPSDTKQFMMAMWSHADNAQCNRYEWVLYNIPSSTTSIPAGNPDNIGTPGGSFPGVPKYLYASPCPDGEGYKTYYFTLYALNDDLASYVDKQDDDYYKAVGPELLLEANKKSMVSATAQFTAKVCFQNCALTEKGLPQVVYGDDDNGECI